MIHLKMKKFINSFGENKDIASEIRKEHILPAIEANSAITLDFEGVSGATQSFIHALLAEPIQKYGALAFDNLFFKNCNPDLAAVITLVYNYLQESSS